MMKQQPPFEMDEAVFNSELKRRGFESKKPDINNNLQFCIFITALTKLIEKGRVVKIGDYKLMEDELD